MHSYNIYIYIYVCILAIWGCTGLKDEICVGSTCGCPGDCIQNGKREGSTCVEKCGSNRYENNNQECILCPIGCSICKSGSECSSCDSLYTLNPNSGECFVSSLCGDNNVDTGEECDFGGGVNGSGCNSVCGIEEGWGCPGGTSCTPECGDGNHIHWGGEECDDGGILPGDGCDSTCHVETGWFCHLGGIANISLCTCAPWVIATTYTNTEYMVLELEFSKEIDILNMNVYPGVENVLENCGVILTEESVGKLGELPSCSLRGSLDILSIDIGRSNSIEKETELAFLPLKIYSKDPACTIPNSQTVVLGSIPPVTVTGVFEVTANSSACSDLIFRISSIEGLLNRGHYEISICVERIDDISHTYPESTLSMNSIEVNDTLRDNMVEDIYYPESPLAYRTIIGHSLLLHGVEYVFKCSISNFQGDNYMEMKSVEMERNMGSTLISLVTPRYVRVWGENVVLSVRTSIVRCGEEKEEGPQGVEVHWEEVVSTSLNIEGREGCLMHSVRLHPLSPNIPLYTIRVTARETGNPLMGSAQYIWLSVRTPIFKLYFRGVGAHVVHNQGELQLLSLLNIGGRIHTRDVEGVQYEWKCIQSSVLCTPFPLSTSSTLTILPASLQGEVTISLTACLINNTSINSTATLILNFHASCIFNMYRILPLYTNQLYALDRLHNLTFRALFYCSNTSANTLTIASYSWELNGVGISGNRSDIEIEGSKLGEIVGRYIVSVRVNASIVESLNPSESTGESEAEVEGEKNENVNENGNGRRRLEETATTTTTRTRTATLNTIKLEASVYLESPPPERRGEVNVSPREGEAYSTEFYICIRERWGEKENSGRWGILRYWYEQKSPNTSQRIYLSIATYEESLITQLPCNSHVCYGNIVIQILDLEGTSTQITHPLILRNSYIGGDTINLDSEYFKGGILYNLREGNPIPLVNIGGFERAYILGVCGTYVREHTHLHTQGVFDTLINMFGEFVDTGEVYPETDYIILHLLHTFITLETNIYTQQTSSASTSTPTPTGTYTYRDSRRNMDMEVEGVGWKISIEERAIIEEYLEDILNRNYLGEKSLYLMLLECMDQIYKRKIVIDCAPQDLKDDVATINLEICSYSLFKEWSDLQRRLGTRIGLFSYPDTSTYDQISLSGSTLSIARISHLPQNITTHSTNMNNLEMEVNKVGESFFKGREYIVIIQEWRKGYFKWLSDYSFIKSNITTLNIIDSNTNLPPTSIKEYSGSVRVRVSLDVDVLSIYDKDHLRCKYINHTEPVEDSTSGYRYEYRGEDIYLEQVNIQEGYGVCVAPPYINHIVITIPTPLDTDVDYSHQKIVISEGHGYEYDLDETGGDSIDQDMSRSTLMWFIILLSIFSLLLALWGLWKDKEYEKLEERIKRYLHTAFVFKGKPSAPTDVVDTEKEKKQVRFMLPPSPVTTDVDKPPPKKRKKKKKNKKVKPKGPHSTIADAGDIHMEGDPQEEITKTPLKPKKHRKKKRKDGQSTKKSRKGGESKIIHRASMDITQASELDDSKKNITVPMSAYIKMIREKKLSMINTNAKSYAESSSNDDYEHTSPISTSSQIICRICKVYTIYIYIYIRVHIC